MAALAYAAEPGGAHDVEPEIALLAEGRLTRVQADPYEPSDSPDFHVVRRSHGPKIPGEVSEQILTFEGGCDVEVGPPPGQSGPQFSIPEEPGECGDIQLYIFETTPA